MLVNEDDQMRELRDARAAIARAHEAIDSYDVPRTNPTFPGEIELTLVARIDYLAALKEATTVDVPVSA